MAIKKLTYTDIPLSLRAKAAGEAQRRLQAVLSDPVATPEQRELARRQQGVLKHWTSGTLPLENPDNKTPLDEQIVPTPESRPDHVVEVSEALSVDETSVPGR